MKKLILSFALFSSLAFGQASCDNNFPNFLTDVCWSCMFPMKLAGQSISISGGAGQEDWDSGVNTPVCGCADQLKLGVPMSFWEPAIIIDSHIKAGCMSTLGGISLPLGGNMQGTNGGGSTKSTTKTAFRQSTYYTSPLMYLLGQVLDDTCSDRSAFNLAWTSEVDPSWNDDTLSAIKMPIQFAFGSMPGVLAGAVDAIASTAGWPISSIFWQAGSWGTMYPLQGNAPYVSDDQFGRLMSARMLAEAHDMGELWNIFSGGAGQSYGPSAMCAQTPMAWPVELVMNKKQYKISRLYPLPQTAKIAGLCCSPIGRTTILSEIGVQSPVPKAKDLGYIIYRKRDCCAGIVK